MNPEITGAPSRHHSPLHKQAAGNSHNQNARVHPGILSTFELRRLVAQMVD